MSNFYTGERIHGNELASCMLVLNCLGEYTENVTYTAANTGQPLWIVGANSSYMWALEEKASNSYLHLVRYAEDLSSASSVVASTDTWHLRTGGSLGQNDDVYVIAAGNYKRYSGTTLQSSWSPSVASGYIAAYGDPTENRGMHACCGDPDGAVMYSIESTYSASGSDPKYLVKYSSTGTSLGSTRLSSDDIYVQNMWCYGGDVYIAIWGTSGGGVYSAYYWRYNSTLTSQYTGHSPLWYAAKNDLIDGVEQFSPSSVKVVDSLPDLGAMQVSMLDGKGSFAPVRTWLLHEVGETFITGLPQGGAWGSTGTLYRQYPHPTPGTTPTGYRRYPLSSHTWHAYTSETTKTALSLDDWWEYPIYAVAEPLGEANGIFSVQNIIDIRDRIEAIAPHFWNRDTGNRYNWTDGSADNLYYVAMGDRTKYGAIGGAAYDWTRTKEEMTDSPMYDIDIGEVYECVVRLFLSLLDPTP